MATTIPVYIHQADGTFKPDDPFIVPGTEIEVIKVDDYWGWGKGTKGVITKIDVELTIQHRDRLKKRKRLPSSEEEDAIFFSQREVGDLVNYQVSAKCLKVIN